MTGCNDCGRQEITKDCEYCGVTYCSDHILPERHGCPGLDDLEGLTPRESMGKRIGDADENDAGVDESQTEKENRDGEAERSTSPDIAPKSKPEPSDPSPDVNPDGSLASESSSSDESDDGTATVSRVRRGLTGLRKSSDYHGLCPYCENYLGRSSQTGPIRTCDECGWGPGLPVLRMITHWPNWKRYKRGVKRLFSTAFKLSVIGLFVLGIAWAVGSGAVPLSGVENLTADGTSAVPNVSASENAFDRAAVEQAIHDEVNERRQADGLRKVGWSPALQAIARNHSEDMIKRDFFSHENPDGHGLANRYDKAGYNCRVDAGVGHSAGGENIAQSWWQRNIKQNGTIRNYETVDELAKGIVDQWMNSQGHRENLLNKYWQQEGIGVALREDGAVFVTQDFC